MDGEPESEPQCSECGGTGFYPAHHPPPTCDEVESWGGCPPCPTCEQRKYEDRWEQERL